jgi:hypothetical protein
MRAPSQKAFTLIRQTRCVDSDVVWWPEASGASRDRVAVVTVSYNTRELTAFLTVCWRRLVASV